jgi:integrase/recombinase XerD
VSALPCPPHLDEQFFDEWLDASGLAVEANAPLFPTMRHGKLAGRTPLPQANVYMMIQHRARTATGITTYLQKGGKAGSSQQMAGTFLSHQYVPKSPRSTL